MKPTITLHSRTRALLVCAIILAGSAGSDEFARAETPAAEQAARASRPLSPLPKPPRLELPTPSPESLKRLDALLAKLVSKEPIDRESAARAILEADAELLPAIHRRVSTIAENSDGEEMKRRLGAAREALRKSEKAAGKAKDDAEKDGPDYVQMLLLSPRPEDHHYKDLLSVVAMGRMLRRIGNVQGARELVNVYVRFGDFLRVFVQRELEAVGDRSLAALIEAERHPAEKIGKWASRQLDLRGKAIATEVVQTNDFQVLSDVLRAYGRNRDPDAARLIVSFANSERAQVREAAREGVALMGEVAVFQLMDTYENIVGKKPSREWSWDRTARELFTEFDRLRMSQVYTFFEQGRAAEAAGNLEAMAAAYDKVLARSPLFDERSQMVPGYLAFARRLAESDAEKAAAVLRRAQRLAGDDPSSRSIQSLLLTLEAELLLSRGIADQVILRRALDLDPGNARARDLLDRVQRGDVETRTTFNRYVAAAAIALVALGSIAVLLLRKPRASAPSTSPGD